MVLKQLLGLTNLLEAQILCIHETTKVIMVHKDKNLIFATFQVVAQGLEYFDNS